MDTKSHNAKIQNFFSFSKIFFGKEVFAPYGSKSVYPPSPFYSNITRNSLQPPIYNPYKTTNLHIINEHLSNVKTAYINPYKQKTDLRITERQETGYNDTHKHTNANKCQMN